MWLLWEEYELVTVTTQSVRISGEKCCGNKNGGIIEVEFYTQHNECTSGIADCHHDATCVDIATGLGYRCPCKFGHYGDGRITGSGCVAKNGSVNVASLVNGGSCMGSSSEYSTYYTCRHALDGLHTYEPGQAWRIRGTYDISPWIEIAFIQYYVIHLARLMQDFRAIHLFKDLKLTFSDSSIQNISSNIALHRFDRHLWEEFQLMPVNTSSVRIDVLTIYSHGLNGFVEIEFYTKSNECEEETHDCHPLATCVDIVKTPGFLCPCNFGYYGDGKMNGFGCRALNHSVNVALATHGGHCDSSSSEASESWFCSGVVDGIETHGVNQQWYSHDNDQEPWVSITFNKVSHYFKKN